MYARFAVSAGWIRIAPTMTHLTSFPVCGILTPIHPETTIADVATACPVTLPFGGLVRLYHSNTVLFQELKTLLANLDSLSAYFDTPGHNSKLANARLLRLKAAP